MQDKRKTKAQLIDELDGLRRQVTELGQARGEPAAAESTTSQPAGQGVRLAQYFSGLSELPDEPDVAIELLATMLDNSPFPIWVFDEDLRVAYDNKISWDFGSGRSVVGITVDGFSPDVCKLLKDGIAACKSSGESLTRESWLHSTVFGECYLHFSFLPLPHGIVACSPADLTEQKLKEKAYTESEERYRYLFEAMGEGIVAIDMEDYACFSLANPAAEKLFGVGPGELVGKRLTDFCDEANIEIINKQLDIRRSGKPSTYEMMLQRADDERRHVQVTASPRYNSDGRFIGSLSLLLDITERKQAEKALLESKERAMALLESSPVPFAVIQDGLVAYVNQLALELLDYKSKSEIVGLPFGPHIHPSDMVRAVNVNRQRMAGEPVPGIHEMRLLDRHEKTIWVEVRSELVDYGGRPANLSALVDITERKRAETQLRTTEQRLAVVIANLDMDVVAYETGGDREFISENIEPLTGYSLEQFLADRTFFVGLIHPDDQPRLKVNISTWHKAGDPGVLKQEFRLRRIDGSVVWIEDRMVRIRPQESKPYMAGILIDVTERKRNEILTRSQRDLGFSLSTITGIDETLRLCLDAAINAANMDCGGIYLFNENTSNLVLACHSGLSAAFVDSVASYSPESSNAKLALSGVPTYSRFPETSVPLDEVHKQEGLQAIAVVPISCQDTIIGCLNVSSHNVYDVPEYSRAALEAIASQIGSAIARATSAAALRQSEERYRTTTDCLTEAIHMVDRELRVVLHNSALDAWHKELGLSPTVDGKRISELYPFLPESTIQEYHQVLDSCEMLSTEESLTVGGRRIYTETHKIPILENGHVSRVITIIRDISERKRSEQVQFMLHRMSAAVLTEPSLKDLLSLVRDEFSKLVDASNFFVALYNESRRLFTFPFAIDEVDKDFAPSDLANSLTEYVFKTEQPLLLKRGSLDPAFNHLDVTTIGPLAKSWLAVPLRAPRGVIGVCVIQSYNDDLRYTEDDLELMMLVSDQVALVVERQRAAEALKESQASLERAQEVAHVGSWELNLHTEEYRWSTELYRIFGLDPTSTHLTRELITNMVHPDDRDNLRRTIARVLSTGEDTGFDLRIVRPDGEVRVIYDQIEAEFEESGEISRLFGIAQDITERHRMAEQLIQEEREQSMLTLAGGVAHDFNNLLMGVMGSASLLRDTIPDTDEASEFCNAIIMSSQRMADLTKQLLTYARGSKPTPRPLDVNAAIRDSLAVLHASIPGDVEVESDFASDLWPVEADRGQLSQVLVNLIINATEAMPTGGKLVIRTMNQESRESWYCPIHGNHPAGDYVTIEVVDTGHGMDARTLDHVFEPFFSTKFQGRGLGLAAVMGIIRSHKGCITAASEPGQGSTFCVYLPRTEKAVPGMAAAKQDQAPCTGTILLVNNDKLVLSTTSRMLTSRGYTVLPASSSNEGFQELQKHMDTVNLVILDAALQLEGDVYLLDALQETAPQVKTAVISGIANNATVGQASGTEPDRVLQKPFTMQALLDVVDELLNAK